MEMDSPIIIGLRINFILFSAASSRKIFNFRSSYLATSQSKATNSLTTRWMRTKLLDTWKTYQFDLESRRN